MINRNYSTVFYIFSYKFKDYTFQGGNYTMIDVSGFASLSFFTVSKYHYIEPTVCNFATSPRPHFCMGLILDGKGVFEFKGKSVEVRKGDIIFVPVGSKYISRWQGYPNVTYISMHFSFFSHAHFPGNKTFEVQKISPRFSGEFDDIFIRAFNTYEKNGCNFSALACFFDVMDKITDRLSFTIDKKYDERIERTVTFIETNYNQNVSVEQLASIAYMSVSHFHATFKSIVGVTPIEYRNNIRIRYAIMSLIKGDKTIETISEELGFESATYFRRVFKKETGCSPSSYNKTHMGI